LKKLYSIFIIALLFLPAPLNRIISQTYNVDTILYQGDVDYPINLVILGDGFLESDLPVFRDLAAGYIDLLFTVEPFNRFNSFFNAFSISVPSNEQGAAMDPDSLIDNYFGSTFNYADIDRLLVPTNKTRVSEVLANNFPEYDQVFMLVNSGKYGGSGGWVATASLNAASSKILDHELGHSFANLADEYYAGDQYAREAINMTRETNLDILKWKNWYGDEDIGLYPHAESPLWYRPHQNCLMRSLGNPFCAVCREGLIETIYAMASPFKGYEPGITSFQMSSDSVVFRLDLNHPEPTSLESQWYLNDIEVGDNADSLTVKFIELNQGMNKLRASVTDTSGWIRPYEYESYHQFEVEWLVSSWPLSSGQEINILNSSAIAVYPNPVKDKLFVKVLDEQFAEAHIELFDSQGKRIQGPVKKYSDIFLLEMGQLDAGIYVIKISLNGKFLSSRKIIK